jgi:methyltransferase (TIGR00027 family)
MIEGRASLTAQVVALSRAILSAEASGRLVDDPYAQAMLPAPLRLIPRGAESAAAGPLLLGLDLAFAGFFGQIASRTLFFDEKLREAVAGGVGQVVILGAGFDTRAIRLAAPGVAFFEVDHPATQATKRSRLAARGIAPGGAFVAVDFTRDDPAAALAAAGHDAARPTFFLWEGVIMYLDEAKVRGALRAIKSRAAPGSALALDAITRVPIDNIGQALFRTIGRAFELLGEPLRLWIEPEALTALLGEEGFLVEELLGADALYARYLAGWARRRPNPIAYVAKARVGG